MRHEGWVPLSEFKGFGWYALVGWGRTREGAVLRYERPADWTDVQWETFCKDLEEVYREIVWEDALLGDDYEARRDE